MVKEFKANLETTNMCEECTKIYSKYFSKKNGYRIRYINRLISRGYEKKHAVETFKAIKNDIDYDTTPESAADDEASYWG